MSSIDNRIVKMEFDNASFQQKAGSTMETMGKLKQSLDLSKSAGGIDEVQKSMSKFSLGGMASAVEGIASKFSTLGIMGVTALTNITNRAVDAGISLAKSLSFDQITGGFAEYELKMGSIQTILANTQKHGTGLQEVTDVLGELNTYADKTIYNFGDMTKNIGLFTNAGLKVDEAASMIKGFSNAAAASGTSAEGASNAAYQLSQALSAGTVRLEDWRSLTNVGMGNKNMQEGIIEIADAMGVFSNTEIDATKASADFNSSLEEKWLTADVMSTYLKIMAGDMDAAAMSSLGLSDATVESFQKQQVTAEEAATKVRTFTQMMDTAKEAVGSGWAQSFEILLGDFDEATEFFSGVSDYLGTMIGKSAETRNALLQSWVDLGGKDQLIEGLKTGLAALGAILAPIKEAFREFFPKKTAEDLKAMTSGFARFMESLTPTPKTLDFVKRAASGVFAVFKMGKDFVLSFVNLFFMLKSRLDTTGDGFLGIAAKVGDFLVGLEKATVDGQLFIYWWEMLLWYIDMGVYYFKNFKQVVSDVFAGFDLGGIEGAKEALSKLNIEFEGSSAVTDKAKAAWVGIQKIFALFGDLFSKIGEKLEPFVSGVKDAFGGFWDAIKEAFATGNADKILEFLQTGLLAGILVLIRKFFKGGGFTFDFNTDVLENLSGALSGVSGSLQAMQTSLKAGALLKIAAAIGILVLSMIALSSMDEEELKRAAMGLAATMGILLTAMAVMAKISSSAGFLKMPIIAASMILLAGAVGLLVLSLKALSNLSWEELKKGLTGVGALLGMLAVAVQPLSAGSSGIIRAGLAMIPLALGLKILATVVKDFAEMSWEEMGKGMAGVATGLLAVTAAMNLMPTAGILRAGLAIIAIAAGMKILETSIANMSQMSWEELAKGLTGVVGALTGIAVAMQLMPKGLAAQAAGVLILSFALGQIGSAVQQMGSMGWETIGKGLATMAGSLIILVGALRLMSGTIQGSVALLLAANAMGVLAPVLLTFATLSWEELGVGLAALAGSLILLGGALTLMGGSVSGAAALLLAATALGVMTPVLMTLSTLEWEGLLIALAALAGLFTIIGVAGLLLAPITPILTLLSVALLAMGGALALAGLGATAFAAAIPILVAAGSEGVSIVMEFLTGFIALIPTLAEALASGLIIFIGKISEAAPTIIANFGDILRAIIDEIIATTPKVGELIGTLIQTLLSVIVENIPGIIDAGISILTNLLDGIAKNIEDVVTKVSDIVQKFLGALGEELPDILEAGAQFIIDFLNGMAQAIRDNMTDVLAAIGEVGVAIVEGLWEGIQGLAGWLWDQVTGWLGDIWDGIMDFFGIASPSKEMKWVGEMLVDGFAIGMEDPKHKGVKAMRSFGGGVRDALDDTLGEIPGVLDREIDLSPTITPVLDISDIKNSKKEMDGLFNNQAVSASAQKAAQTSAVYERAMTNGPADSYGETTEVNMNFEQNIYAPEAPSVADVYRNTGSQLAQARKVLMDA